MENEPKLWNKTECLKWLKKFDAFEHKYLYPNISIESEKCIENWNDILNAQSHGASNHNFSCAEERDAALGIRQVYADDNHYTNEYIEMLNLVRDKFIYDYTGIDGLCDFFSPAYFEYEWGMHLEIDYENHDSCYYRDHYVHQIRNMFEMFELLDDFGYYEKCKRTYENPENSIGTFILEAINKEILQLNCTDKELYAKIICLRQSKENLSAAKDPLPWHRTDKELYAKIICLHPSKENLSAKKASVPQHKTDKELYAKVVCLRNDLPEIEDFVSAHRKELSDLMMHYIIYTAVIIASLVHDIGYPITYIHKISGRLNAYLPISRLLASADANYSEIKQSLQGSLLFKIVKPDIIEKWLQGSDNKHHGAESAVVLLKYFYMHGEQLSNLQRCAVELAALIIYNHTNKYDIINDAHEELIRSDIYKDPLSHIFRMCDDLQEWDRVYFEITDKSNIFICPECHTPVLRKFGTDTELPEFKIYSCCCKKQAYYDTGRFVNRRILNVIGCEGMTVEKMVTNEGANDTKYFKQNPTLFKMYFDCGALLDILTFNQTYGRKRADDVKKLKRLCSYQGAYDTILVDLFVSNNPIVVKIEILEQYRQNFCCKNAKAAEILKPLMIAKTKAYKTWMHNLEFYLALISIKKNFCKNCKDELEGEAFKDFKVNTTNRFVLAEYDKVYKELCKEFRKAAKAELLRTSILKEALAENDCLLELCIDYLMQQIHKEGYEKTKAVVTHKDIAFDLVGTKKEILYRMFYEKLYCSDKTLDEYVNEYVSRSAYDAVKESCYNMNSASSIDFFVDYGLFIKLWDRIKEQRRFFFDVYGVHNGEYVRLKADTWFKDNRVGKPTRLIPANAGSNTHKSEIILKCITQSEEFSNEYRFDVYKKNDKDDYDREGVLTVAIDWDKHKATLKLTDTNNKSEIKELLENNDDIFKHHGIISFSFDG